MQPMVDAINALEEALKKLTDAELKAKTAEFKQKLDNGATLDDILVEAFAVCREAEHARAQDAPLRRAAHRRHGPAQGQDRRDATGEGKTLVATLPCYLNALEGKGVHVVTVNDYLAKRDAEWMGQLYGFLGLSIGAIVNQQSDAREEARLPSRHQLRPEQRVRLRLPARQHEVLARSTTRSAR